MDLPQIALIAAGVLGLILVSILLYIVPLPVFFAAKSLAGYASKFLLPVWMMVRRKGWYTVAAIVLSFSSVLIHLHSLASTQKLKYWDLALGALHNTFTSSFAEIVQSGQLLISGPSLIQFGTSVVLILMAVSKIYFWYILWNFIKKRVPDFAFWVSVTFSFLVLVWGGEGSEALFNAFEFMQTAADQAGSQVSVDGNTTS